MRHTAGVETQPQFSRWLMAAALLISLAGLLDHDLWTPDEPREAAIALDMSRNSDWIVPHLAGQPFVEKPPLYYNIAALWLRLSPFATPCAGWLRLTSAFFGLGTLAMTWLLARRLLGRSGATSALLVLATLPGFIHVTHWLLTDVALMFFVTAALWALAEAYLACHPALLILTGLFATGAFLTKGLIGPVFIALGGLPLLLISKPWRTAAVSHQLAAIRHSSFAIRHPLTTIFYHLAALFTFALPVAVWALLFWQRAGRVLFMEWFWTNHFGRFSGAATQLGHIAGPFYYFGALLIYVLPWLPPLGWAFWRIAREGALLRKLVLPLAWGLGGLLLLSLSATKREIYLAPLLPAFALLAAHSLAGPLPRGLAWCATPRFVGPLIVLYLLGLTVAEPLVDRHKSYGSAFREFNRQVTARGDLRAAGWELDETTRAGFVWYADKIFPALTNRAEVGAVLAGTHPQFNAIVICQKSGETLPAEFSANQETVVRMGAHRALLLLAHALPTELKTTDQGSK